MAKRQYPRADDLSVEERLKLVAKLHARGFSHIAIAKELDYSSVRALHDVNAIRDQYREMENIQEYLKDVVERTRELLQRLKEQENILWKQLDWANEWVVQRDGFGNALKDLDENGKECGLLFGPREPSQSRAIISQIQSLNKQQAEMLGILNKNVDITVKLEQTEKIQVIILENIREADPRVFSTIRRQLVALQASTQRPDLSGLAPGRSMQEVIEGEYEVRHA